MAEPREAVARRIGRRLAAAIDEAGMNQVGFAKAMKKSEGTVSRWINGETLIDVDVLERAAAILGKPPYYFLGLEPPNPDYLFGDKFRDLTEDDKQTVRDLIESLSERRRKTAGM